MRQLCIVNKETEQPDELTTKNFTDSFPSLSDLLHPLSLSSQVVVEFFWFFGTDILEPLMTPFRVAPIWVNKYG